MIVPATACLSMRPVIFQNRDLANPANTAFFSSADSRCAPFAAWRRRASVCGASCRPVHGRGRVATLAHSLRRCRVSAALSPRDRPVFDPMRLRPHPPQPPPLVLFIRLEVPLEPLHVAVALERQDVRRQPVQKPPIVADDHRAAGELDQRILQRAQRIHIQIVGRLIQQDHVVLDLQHLRQVHPVALAARQDADLLLLVRPLEVERPHIGARRHAALAQVDQCPRRR